MFILATAGFPAVAFFCGPDCKNVLFVNLSEKSCAKYTKMGISFCDAQNKCNKCFEILNIKSK